MDLVAGINVKIMNDFLWWKLMHHQDGESWWITISSHKMTLARSRSSYQFSYIHLAKNHSCSTLLFALTYSKIAEMYIIMMNLFRFIPRSTMNNIRYNRKLLLIFGANNWVFPKFKMSWQICLNLLPNSVKFKNPLNISKFKF